MKFIDVVSTLIIRINKVIGEFAAQNAHKTDL